MGIAALHGFILSLGLILPLGMQNGFILMQGALHSRWSKSLPTIITAGLCDTALITLAVVGVSAAALHTAWLRYLFGAVGIGFLLYIGWSTWNSSGQMDITELGTDWTVRKQIGFTSSVSLLNPHALIDTLAVIGGSALVYTRLSEKISFGAACVLVSWVWFIILSVVGHTVGRIAVQKRSFGTLNRVSAVMMWASAVYLAYVIATFQ